MSLENGGFPITIFSSSRLLLHRRYNGSRHISLCRWSLRETLGRRVGMASKVPLLANEGQRRVVVATASGLRKKHVLPNRANPPLPLSTFWVMMRPSLAAR